MPRTRQSVQDPQALLRGLDAADDGIRAGVGRAGEPEGDHASRVGDDQARGRQAGELRTSRRCVHLCLAEAGKGAVDFGE